MPFSGKKQFRERSKAYAIRLPPEMVCVRLGKSYKKGFIYSGIK
jgi:hypothetical protein